MIKNDLDFYTNSLDRIAKELVSNGYTLEEAILVAPEIHQKQEMEFSTLLLNLSFKADCIRILRSNTI